MCLFHSNNYLSRTINRIKKYVTYLEYKRRNFLVPLLYILLRRKETRLFNMGFIYIERKGVDWELFRNVLLNTPKLVWALS